MQSTVEEGMLREKEFLNRHCSSTEQLTVSTVASADGESIESMSDFEPFEGGEVAPMAPPADPPYLIGGYTEDEWEVWLLREEVERLRSEKPKTGVEIVKGLAAHVHAGCVAPSSFTVKEAPFGDCAEAGKGLQGTSQMRAELRPRLQF